MSATAGADLHLQIMSLARSGRLWDAVALCESGLAVDSSADFRLLCEHVAVANGALGVGLNRYTEALDKDPENIRAWVALAAVENLLFQFENAGHSARRALQLDPKSVQARLELATSLDKTGQLSQAADELTTAVEMSTRTISATINLALLEMQRLNHAAGVSLLARAVDHSGRSSPVWSKLLLSRCYQWGEHEDDIAQAHRKWGEWIVSLVPRCNVGPVSYCGRRPLRVGYLTSDACDHSVAYFLEPILRHHNRDRVEAFVFSNVGRPDAVTARVRKTVGSWRDIRGLRVKTPPC